MIKKWVGWHQRYGGDAVGCGRDSGARKRPKRWRFGDKIGKLGGGGRSIWRGDAKVTLVGVGGGRQEADGLAVSEGRASMAYELPMMMMTCCYGGA